MSIKATFKCEGRVGHYKPGKIYTEVLTPYLEALLRRDQNLRLIDPLTVDEYKAKVLAAQKADEDAIAEAKSKAEERVKNYGSKKSSSPAAKSGPDSGSSSEDRATEESGERSEGSEESSSDE